VGRARRILVFSAGVLVLVAVLAQVFLPRIAASRISSRVGRYGAVKSVSVTAWPAVELLWGKADSVSVRAGSLVITPSQTAALLWEARGVSRLDFSSPSVREGRLQLSHASLHKRGDELAGQARMSEAAVSDAVPAGIHLQLLSSERGAVTVRARATGAGGGLLGLRGPVDVVAEAINGALVARPLGERLGGVHLTLFSDPRVAVKGVGAGPLTGAGGAVSYRLTIAGRLR
jgi:hypothetical protein